MSEKKTVNIALHLPKMAEIKPDTMAVVIPDGRSKNGIVRYIHYTLSQLNDKSDNIAHGLVKAGIKKGMRTVLMVKPGLDFFALTFALFKIGAVPVMIDPGIGLKNLGKCLSEALPEAFIGITKAHIARVLFGWGRHTIKKFVTVGRKLFWGGSSIEEITHQGEGNGRFVIAETTDDDIAAILFTSGSTGISKGAIYTHGIFDSQVKFLRNIYKIEPGEMDLATFPLFALFGPALGMTAVIPDMDASRPAEADPEKLIETIKDFGTTNLFASPALINKIGRYGEEHGIKLTSLKRVISAGAPARPDAIKRFSKMLSDAVEIFTPYGATEALPVCNIGSKEILGETAELTSEGKGVCIGKPVPEISLEIIKITDEPVECWSEDLILPDGETGEIAVKGPIVTREYYNRKEETRLAKIPDPVSGGFYHRMGDTGYKDHLGRIWFCGRKSQRLVTPYGTLFTIPCEAVFNAHPDVYRTALVGVRKNGVIEPVICVELEKNIPDNDKDRIKKELLEIGGKKTHTKNIKTFLFHKCFPVDIRHNAKIFREKLAEWAGRQLK